MRVWYAAAIAATLAQPVLAQAWFMHTSGEIRAYHGDWLAVCADEGNGPCRVVATAVDPGSNAFFDLRLAAHRIDNSPDWAVEVMDRSMPASQVETLTFTFDGEATTIPRSAWKAGDFLYGSVVDTLVIRDPAVAADLVEKMKAGNRVVITYAPTGRGDGEASFPLRGVTAAMNASESRVLERQE
ncbi:MAG: hypothetical protein AAF631_10640 [Pseudomonadota bacterium]